MCAVENAAGSFLFFHARKRVEMLAKRVLFFGKHCSNRLANPCRNLAPKLCVRPAINLSRRQIQTDAAESPSAPASDATTAIAKAKSNGRFFEQLRENQATYAQHLLLARVGDFYEFYFEQAECVSRLLGLKLARGTYRERQHVFCGFPSYKLNDYVKLLIDRGHSVAKYEQYEKRQSNGQIIMERLVDRIYTPGTLIEEEFVETSQNHFLVALASVPSSAGLALNVGFACVDVSTAEFYVGECGVDELPHKLAVMNPREILVAARDTSLVQLLKTREADSDNGARLAVEQDDSFDAHFAQNYLASRHKMTPFAESILPATGGLLNYVLKTHGGLLPHLDRPAIYDKDVMGIDSETQKSLELHRSIRRGTRQGSLLHLLDQTMTPLGARTLAQRIRAPSAIPTVIERRLDLVQFFYDSPDFLEVFRSLLAQHCTLDTARALQKLRHSQCGPWHLGVVLSSLEGFDIIRDAFVNSAKKSPLVGVQFVKDRLETWHLPLELARMVRGMMVQSDDLPKLLDRPGMLNAEYF
jgi:DNA mismatch repair protein MutS